MTTRVSTDEALAILAEVVNEPVGELVRERMRESVAGWDSMGVLLLIAELDERFGVELSADDSRQMRRVDDFLAFMRKHELLQD